jgi:hypothetical protein
MRINQQTNHICNTLRCANPAQGGKAFKLAYLFIGFLCPEKLGVNRASDKVFTPIARDPSSLASTLVICSTAPFVAA